MTAEWETVYVDPNALDEIEDEPLGTKEKFWVQNPDDGSAWLFKFAREVDGRVMGEDWAEWVVHQIGLAMGIPTADIRPAECAGRRGIVSKTVVPANSRLVLGNSVLVERDPQYDPVAGRHNPGYTIAAIQQALAPIDPPPGYPELASMGAYDVWAGYLVMDALVAGRDRHHENWGILSGSESRSLAPSFDHGNALGFQETDEKRQRCLESPAMMTSWSRRGKSHHFVGQPELVSLACYAISRCTTDAAIRWRVAVERVSPEMLRDIVDLVPETIMSAVTRSFVVELVAVNRRRLLDAYPDGS